MRYNGLIGEKKLGCHIHHAYVGLLLILVSILLPKLIGTAVAVAGTVIFLHDLVYHIRENKIRRTKKSFDPGRKP